MRATSRDEPDTFVQTEVGIHHVWRVAVGTIATYSEHMNEPHLEASAATRCNEGLEQHLARGLLLTEQPRWSNLFIR